MAAPGRRALRRVLRVDVDVLLAEVARPHGLLAPAQSQVDGAGVVGPSHDLANALQTHAVLEAMTAVGDSRTRQTRAVGSAGLVLGVNSEISLSKQHATTVVCPTSLVCSGFHDHDTPPPRLSQPGASVISHDANHHLRTRVP